MARSLNTQELTRLARLGARARLAELDRERADILRAFPDLRRAAPAEPAAPARPRMSAAARKAASERMRKYWAERRKAAKAPAAK